MRNFPEVTRSGDMIRLYSGIVGISFPATRGREIAEKILAAASGRPDGKEDE